jgi:hypothetical protein
VTATAAESPAVTAAESPAVTATESPAGRCTVRKAKLILSNKRLKYAIATPSFHVKFVWLATALSAVTPQAAAKQQE